MPNLSVSELGSLFYTCFIWRIKQSCWKGFKLCIFLNFEVPNFTVSTVLCKHVIRFSHNPTIIMSPKTFGLGEVDYIYQKGLKMVYVYLSRCVGKLKIPKIPALHTHKKSSRHTYMGTPARILEHALKWR